MKGKNDKGKIEKKIAPVPSIRYGWNEQRMKDKEERKNLIIEDRSLEEEWQTKRIGSRRGGRERKRGNETFIIIIFQYHIF